MKRGTIVTLIDWERFDYLKTGFPELAIVVANLPESTYSGVVLDRNLYGYGTWEDRLLRVVGIFEGAKNTEQLLQPDASRRLSKC